ncbi:hypothetical protein [uncultured Fusobacterium sp.]|uniref:hypothetical protein n=1 Tax=uncultured Fusobacterium sp. TaxID=159267 RepID=UPI0025E482BD|nr:hypothetical protein [uncultured Fusobacterium sp.]
MVSKVYILNFLKELAGGLESSTRKSRTKKIASCKVKAEKTEEGIMFYILHETLKTTARFDKLSAAKLLFELLKGERI